MRCLILSKYTGVPCAHCGHPFTDQDDVVVCPECGAPHHRSCYRDLGHCALQEQHAPDFSWSYHAPHDDSSQGKRTVICSRCGAATPAELPNCQMCGNPLRPSDRENGPSSERAYRYAPDSQGYFDDWEFQGVSAREFSAYTGGSSYYFLNQFKRLVRSHGNISWNWPAFLFGFPYFFYRRMYRFGLLLLLWEFLAVLPTMACFIVGPLDDNITLYGMQIAYNAQLLSQFSILGDIIGMLRWGVMILCGLFANKLYLRQAIRQIKRFREEHGVDSQYYYSLAMLGRPNPLAIALLFAAFFIGSGLLGSVMQITPVV